jgi:hypothetical protein
MKPIIEIIVSPNGDISIDAQNFAGPDCETATRYLEEALGTVSNRERKPAFHRRQKTKQKQGIGT